MVGTACLALLATLPLLLVTSVGEAVDRSRNDDLRSPRLHVGASTGNVTLTVYQNQNLALVQDERTVPLKEGLSEYEFGGVSDKLLPNSVQLEAPEAPDALQLVEQLFRNEVPSADRLLKAHIGEEIEVFASGGQGTYHGQLVSAQGGVVLREDSGRLRVITDATRFHFPPADGVTGDPTLLLTLQSQASGAQPIRLSYLSEGLSWDAHYAAVLGEDRSQVELKSWVTIANKTGMDFPEVALNLIAGRIHRVREEGISLAAPEAAQAVRREAQTFQEREAFEYHRYTLGRPASLPQGETVRQAFLPSASFDSEPAYIYEAHRVDGVQVWVKFENAGDGQKPLPAGLVRIYQRGPEGLLFLGEDEMDHAPVGEQVELFAGLAFDLSVERVRMTRERLGENAFRESYEITLRNQKSEDVVVSVRERLRGDWTIVQSTPEFTKLDASTAEFRVPVAARESSRVKYTVEYRF